MRRYNAMKAVWECANCGVALSSDMDCVLCSQYRARRDAAEKYPYDTGVKYDAGKPRMGLFPHEVAKFVRSNRSHQETIDQLTKENERLSAEVHFVSKELGVQLGMLGRSAEYKHAREMAGILWAPVDEDPHAFTLKANHLRYGFLNRVWAFFGKRSLDDTKDVGSELPKDDNNVLPSL